jgi:hypothetical protein
MSQPESSLPNQPQAPALPALRAIVTYLADENDLQPVGMRVIEPPADTKQAVRGNLYAVVELGGNEVERVRLSEHLLSAMQRSYYTAKGSQAVVLSEAMHQAQIAVDEFNANHPDATVNASMACVALLRRRLMIACSGSAFALVREGSKIELLPHDPGTVQAVSGGESAPLKDQDILRWELQPGDAALVAGPGWAERVPMRTLAATLAYVTPDNLEDASGGLLDASAGVRSPGLLLVFEETSPQPVAKPTFLTSAGVRRAGVAGLPTSVGATLAVTGAQLPPATPGGAVTSVPVVPPASTAPVDRTVAASSPATNTQPAPENTARGIGRVAALFRTMLPEKRQPEDQQSVDDEPEIVQSLASASATPAPAHNQPSAPAFTPPAPSSGSRARLFIGLALLLLILVPVIVLAIYWQQGVTQRADADALITLAQARVDSAQDALDGDEQDTALSLLSEADEYLNSAEQIVGRTTAIDETSVVINRMLQDVMRVEPLYGLVSPLVQFPAGAQASQVLVIDQNIYVLDAVRQVIESFRLDSSLEIVPDTSGTVVLSQGDVVDGVTVGPLLDMTWQAPITGIQDRSALLVLDDNNRVFRFDPRVEGPSVLELADSDKWQDVRQIEVYQGRLYVADAGTGQIYRFEPGQYETAPTPWFAQPVNLSDMRTMRIDGEIWILLNTGQVLRYFDKQQVPFSLDNSVGLIEQPIDLVVGDDTNPYLYLVDRAGERIWVYDKNGKYTKQFAAAEGHPLRGLSSLFIEDVTDLMYLLTDSSLYKHPLPLDGQ